MTKPKKEPSTLWSWRLGDCLNEKKEQHETGDTQTVSTGKVA